MIVAHAKPLQEIFDCLRDVRKVLVLGCGECVTVCHAGGEKEVAVLAEALRIKARTEGKDLTVLENTIRRQCDPEFVDPVLEDLQDVEAIVSLACGVGVNHLVDRGARVPVYPGVNTTHMGAAARHGVWEERCAGCGECILDLTGGICPIARCAKQILNGPCGGCHDGMCEVSTPENPVPCAWAQIWERAEQLGTLDKLREVLAAKDWSTARDGGPRRHRRTDLLIDEEDETYGPQPDVALPPAVAHLAPMPPPREAPAEDKAGSRLERVLASGEFALTAELGPPMGPDADAVRRKVELLRGKADAVNITDCQTAVVRLSSMAAAVMLVQAGVEPVMQITTRDRNRIAIQADVLGAAGLGVKNVLCIAGDHQSFSAAGKQSGHPGAKNVYDLDSLQLTAMLRRMRDEGRQEGGDPVAPRPRLLLGAAWTPLGDPRAYRVARLAKKVEAGADFIQTQAVYDVEAFAEVMEAVRREGLHERVAILAGIIVPKSAGMLRYMHASVPGVTVPDALVQRFPKVKKRDPADKKKAARRAVADTGKRIAVELIEACRAIPGVRGVHLQSIEWEEAVPEIVQQAGLLPRP